MGQVKELQMNVQYIMNVLSARGEQKASEAFENVLTALGYKPAENVRDGAVLIPVPDDFICTDGLDGMYGNSLNTVGELRGAMSELSDDDQITLVTIDLDTGDEQDHYPMHLDVIGGIRLTDGSVVNEVQFVQERNCEPDTRDKQRVVDALIDVLAEDIAKGDVTVLDELLLRMPFDVLKYALPEDMWADFETPEDSCKQSGQHLKSCDDDGFCNNCGNQ
jgi:hypothetical protein